MSISLRHLLVVIAGCITDRGLEWGPMAATAVITLVPVLILVWAPAKTLCSGAGNGVRSKLLKRRKIRT